MQSKLVNLIMSLLMFLVGAAIVSEFSHATLLGENHGTPYPVGVDFRDISRYRSTQYPDIVAIQNHMRLDRNKEAYFGNSAVSFNTVGVHKHQLDNTVFGITLFQQPRTTTDGQHREFFISSFVRFRTRAYFRRVRVTLTTDSHRVENIQEIDTIPAANTDFHLMVSLYDRKIVLRDSRNGLRITYPVGVGMIDNVTSASLVRQPDGSMRRTTRIVTPTFRNARLMKRTAQFAKDEGFLMRPYMPITTASGEIRNIAFHINPVLRRDADEHAVPRQRDILPVRRGFVSNGCMRMNEKDVYELYYILRTQPGDFMRVDVALQVPSLDEEPVFPRLDDGYNRVVNFGTEEAPFERRRSHEPGGRPLRIDQFVRLPIPAASEITAVDGDNWSEEERDEYGLPIEIGNDVFDDIHGFPNPNTDDFEAETPEEVAV